MLSRLLLAAAAAAALAAAAHQSLDAEVFLERAGVRTSMTLAASGYTGDAAQVMRDGERLHGVVLGALLEANVRGDRVLGALGGAAIDFRVRREGEAALAEGTYAGLPLELRLSDHALSGHVATCAYALTRSTGDYEGSSSCTGAPSPTRVHLPADLRARELPEQLLSVAFLLGSSAGAYEVTGTRR